MDTNNLDTTNLTNRYDQAVLIMRVGLVFVIGNLSKLSLLLSGKTLFTLPDLISRSQRYIDELRGTNVTTA